MTGLEMLGAGVAGGTILGYLLNGARKWFQQESTVETLSGSHKKLKEEFIGHKDDHKIHLDPERDPAVIRELKETILDRFDRVDGRLDKIDNRCEARGKECTNHFTGLERKIAATTGKANGD